MATIWVPDETRDKIREAMVIATKACKRPVKKGEVVNVLINKGFENLKAEDWRRELNQ